jgi:hypothetical protein
LVNHHSFFIDHLRLSPELPLLWVHLTSIATLLHSILTSAAAAAAPVEPTAAAWATPRGGAPAAAAIPITPASVVLLELLMWSDIIANSYVKGFCWQ